MNHTNQGQMETREGLRDILVRLYSQDVTMGEFWTAGGAIYGMVAAVLLRVNYEGGMTKELRVILGAECTIDCIPEGTVKPVMAAARRLAPLYPSKPEPGAELTAVHLELVDQLRADFPTTSALLGHRSK